VSRGWLVPLTGVAFVALAIIGFAVGGEPPDVNNPPQEIVDFYVDDKDSVQAGAFLVTLAVVFLIFFGNHLRRVLDAARDTALSATVLVGAAVMAVGLAIDSTISFALSEAAEDIDPTAVQALQALWDNDWMPIGLGAIVFLVSAGISILQTGALPKWLGWVALALGVAAATPIGFVALLGGGIWILVVSVLLAARERAGTSTPPPVSSAP
jgi:hypothetical protein